MEIKRAAPTTEFSTPPKLSTYVNLFKDFVQASLVATKVVADHKRVTAPKLTSTPDNVVLDRQSTLENLAYSVTEKQLGDAYELALHCLMTPLTDKKHLSQSELLLNRLITLLPRQLQPPPDILDDPLAGAYLQGLKHLFLLILSGESGAPPEFTSAYQALHKFNDRFVSPCQTGISIAQLVGAWHHQCSCDPQSVVVWQWLFNFLSRESQPISLVMLQGALHPPHELALMRRVMFLSGTKYALREATVRNFQPIVEQLTQPVNPVKPYQALPVLGRLRVCIHRARNIHKGNYSVDGRCDAYVQVIYNLKDKCSAVQHGMSDPVWEWNRCMWDRWARGPIVIKLWDKDPLKDKLLGSRSIAFQDIAAKPVAFEWFSLTDANEDGPQLMLSITNFSLVRPNTCDYQYDVLYRVLMHRVFFQGDKCGDILSEFAHRYGISQTHHDRCLLELLTSHMTTDDHHLDSVIALLDIADSHCIDGIISWVKQQFAVLPPCLQVFQIAAKLKNRVSDIDWLLEMEAGASISFNMAVDGIPFDSDEPLEWAAKLFALMETLHVGYAPIINDRAFREAFVRGGVTVIALAFAEKAMNSNRIRPVVSQTFSLYFVGRRILEVARVAVGRQVADAMLPLDHMLTPALGRWSILMVSRLCDWSDSAVDLDDWKSISTENDFLHSTSVVDLFSSIYQAHAFLETLHWDYNGETHVVIHDYFDEVSCQVVHRYGKAISSTLSHYLTTVDYTRFRFSDEMGVRLNNLQVVRTNLLKLMMMLEDEGDQDVSGSFSKTQRFLKDTGRECINQISDVIAQTIESLVSKIIEPKEAMRQKRKKVFLYLFSHLRDSDGDGIVDAKDNDDDNDGIHDDVEARSERQNIAGAHLDQLTLFLDSQLQIAHNSLYYRLFRGLMREIWQRIVNELCDQLVCAVYEVEVIRAKRLLKHLSSQFGGEQSLIKAKLQSTEKQFDVVFRGRNARTPDLVQFWIDSEGELHTQQCLLAIMKSRKTDRQAQTFYKLRSQSPE